MAASVQGPAHYRHKSDVKLKKTSLFIFSPLIKCWWRRTSVKHSGKRRVSISRLMINLRNDRRAAAGVETGRNVETKYWLDGFARFQWSCQSRSPSAESRTTSWVLRYWLYFTVTSCVWTYKDEVKVIQANVSTLARWFVCIKHFHYRFETFETDKEGTCCHGDLPCRRVSGASVSVRRRPPDHHAAGRHHRSQRTAPIGWEIRQSNVTIIKLDQ